MWPFSSRTDTAEHPADRPSTHGQDASDPALLQKKRARRRLIGAISVALIAIIVLPLVFDSEPKLIGDDIAIKIPDQNTPFTPQSPQKPIEPAAESAPPAATNQSAPTETSSVTAPVTAPAVAPVATPAEPVKTEPTLPATKETPKAAVKEVSKETPKEVAKEPVKAPAKSSSTEKEREAKRAQAALEGKEVPKETPKEAPKHTQTAASDGKFVVQLGAFSSVEKVKPLQDKLTAAGIKSYTQKVQSAQGERIRLRVGPYTDRADAERMLKKVKAAGLPGTVLSLK